MSGDNRAVVRRVYEEVWSRRRVEGVNEIISPSHGLHETNVSGSAIGPDAYKRVVTRWITAFPDLRFTIEDTVCEKDKLVVSWNISGTHKGEYLGIAPTNRKISVDGITISHIAGGKIMDSYASCDALGMMQQLGAIPALGPPTGPTAT